MTDHVLTTLLNRRAELAGDLDRAQGNVQQLKADLASLDAVIRQFDPAYNSEVIRPKYRRALGARLGSVGRTVLDTLRLADRPLSVKAIAEQVISARGLNAEDRALSRLSRSGSARRSGISGRKNWCMRRADQGGFCYGR